MKRADMIAQLTAKTEWDIVIIGGGATGLGCAVDAASRGYKTLLIEQYDFGKGTSGKSTKLVHGGVRYLAQGNIKLVMEALRERACLLRNAPRVTSVAEFVVPVFSRWEKLFYGIGLKLYDVLAGKLSLGKTRWLNKKETLQYLQGIKGDKLYGGILYFDGQFDDTRLAFELADTAVLHGAVVLNYVKAKGFLKKNKRIVGIRIHDTIDGTTYDVNAKAVINATGVYVDEVRKMDEPSVKELVAPSQGVHIVIDSSFFPGSAAMMIPKTDDGRVLFAVPWHRKVIIGTTDTPVGGTPIEPKPLPEEIDFILHHANKYLSDKIEKKHILSTFAGLRPLIKWKGVAATKALSRDHTIVLSESGLTTVSGGKWTTYRKIAEDVIDKAIVAGDLPKKECVTKTLRIGKQNGVPDAGEFLKGGVRLSEEDIRYFITEEMAMKAEDILARRTRLLFLDAREAVQAAPFVAGVMAKLMGKDDGWIENEIQECKAFAKGYLPELDSD